MRLSGVLCVARQIIGHIGDELLQAITYTCTGTTNKRNIKYTKQNKYSNTMYNQMSCKI